MVYGVIVELTSNTIFFSQRTKKKSYQVQVEIGGETVQGFQNKSHNQKANNLYSKPYFSINQN